MTDQPSLDVRRREIRDSVLPRALARVGREAIAAHVQMPKYRELVDSLKTIESDLESLSRLQAPAQAEIEQFYVLRRQRRAGYAEFGEAVMRQLPSEAMPNAFEHAVRNYRAIHQELASLEIEWKESTSAKKTAPNHEPATPAPPPKPIPSEPESVFSVSATPPPPSAFDIPDVPDIGEPLHIPHSLYVPPLYKRAYYSLVNVWDFVQPYYGVTIVALLVCLFGITTFRVVQPRLSEALLDRPESESTTSAAPEESEAFAADVEVAPPESVGASGWGVDFRMLAVLAVLNMGAALVWVLSRFTGVGGELGQTELDEGGNLRVYDPTERHPRKRRVWKPGIGSAVTPAEDEQEFDQAPRIAWTNGLRWLLPVVILLNIGVLVFIRSPLPAPMSENAGALFAVDEETADAPKPREVDDLEGPPRPDPPVATAPDVPETAQTLDEVAMIARPIESVHVRDATNGQAYDIEGRPVLYTLRRIPTGDSATPPSGVLGAVSDNAAELNAYANLASLPLAAYSRVQPGAPAASVAVFPMLEGQRAGSNIGALAATREKAATLPDLIERFGAPADYDRPGKGVVATMGIDLPTRWWGDIGVTINAGGKVEHVLVRKPVN